MSQPITHDGRVLGLTGGIGSGKSAVAAIFGELGVPVIDVDRIAHELTAPGGAAIGDIRKIFGEALIGADGALDRAAMRRLVFGDVQAKHKLEAILHPLIGIESQRRCRAALASAPYAVLEVPLLIESGTYRNRVARIAVVDCREETQIERVISRSGLGREDVQRIMAAQAGRAERLAVADDVIDNEGPPAHLRPQIEALHRKYLDMLAAKKSLAGG
ncbi:dephospho-CoA kinase [Sterolibacterium denitrificans]|uniref:Dephospho-CoA kinase n=1 Tax=Sterolibacterium denitrificans TaxID=157592 RepID=A0A7Z7HPH0_9PROT|nr:dephospho-CoA kinase [Sterolibacterium denitrificans]SMB22728.1 dephospho-CoA kinase [Sterolibacterium denitrificans]